MKKEKYIKPEFEYWSAEELNQIEAKMSGGVGNTGQNIYQILDSFAARVNIIGTIVEAVWEEGSALCTAAAQKANQTMKEIYGGAITIENSQPISTRLFNFYITDFALTSLLSNTNRQYNYSQSGVSGFIGHQGGRYVNNVFVPGPADKYKYGFKKMDFNGCELIATYNALKYIGKWTDIRDIAYYCEWNGSALYGLLGTNPNGIKKYLDEEKGLNTAMYTANYSGSYDSLLSNGRVGIVTFWWGRDSFIIHSVMVVQNQGRIKAYNYLSNELYHDFDSISHLISYRQSIPISLLLIK